jgi:hypothetical protein
LTCWRTIREVSTHDWTQNVQWDWSGERHMR